MNQEFSEVKLLPQNYLSFKEHCSPETLSFIKNITVDSSTITKGSLYEGLEGKEHLGYSRWLFWSIFSGLVDPESEPEKNLERIILLKKEYEVKRVKYLKGLLEAEQSDVDNPLSVDYRICFEIETKNQIKIDLVRMSFRREFLTSYNTNLFNILYVWGFENSAIGYRQGFFIRNE
jgi:hypothetical protein